MESKLSLLLSKIRGGAMKPSDFYFWIYKDEEDIVPCGYIAVVTLKDLWDRDGVWDDTSASIQVVPTGFYEIMDSQFEYFGTFGAARQALLDAGFIENDDIMNAPRP